MDDIITRGSEEYKALDEAIGKAKADIEKLLSGHRPTIEGERYLTTEEVCECFGISRRALQNYRDERTIPHTSVAGKILYPLSEIERILAANYKAAVER